MPSLSPLIPEPRKVTCCMHMHEAERSMHANNQLHSWQRMLHAQGGASGKVTSSRGENRRWHICSCTEEMDACTTLLVRAHRRFGAMPDLQLYATTPPQLPTRTVAAAGVNASDTTGAKTKIDKSARHPAPASTHTQQRGCKLAQTSITYKQDANINVLCGCCVQAIVSTGKQERLPTLASVLACCAVVEDWWRWST